MSFSAQGILNDTQIALEKAAVERFGTVVEDFARGSLNGIRQPATASEPTVNRRDGSWYATSYAAALAGSDFRPKLKFLFKVEFIFTEAAKAAFRELNNVPSDNFTFMIKSVDRPKIDFEYEEDVNMYNFRTKVLKKIRHRDLTLVFMDDVGNRVFDFYRALMMIHSPITRRQLERDNSLKNPEAASLISGSGMAFSNSRQDNAHRAVVNSTFGNSIEAIRVQQIFVDPAMPLASTTKMVSFDFLNPRIISFDFDELSHEQNDVSLMTMVFDYDWMEMVKVGSLGTSRAPYDSKFSNIKANGVNGAPSDITPVRSSGIGGDPRGNNSGLSGALNSVLDRGVRQLTADTIGRAVQTVAGNGRFATQIGSAISSSVGGPINSLISGGVRDRLNGIISSAQAPNARASASTVVDRSTAGPDRPLSVVASSTAYGFTSPAADV
jgi:hypothetical protein